MVFSFLQHAIAKIKVPAVDQSAPVHLGTVEHCATLHVHQCAHKAINYKIANAVCMTYTYKFVHVPLIACNLMIVLIQN